jgi:hypothetical protein
MNFDQAIIEEIYNTICQHLPNEYQEIPIDPNSPIKRVVALESQNDRVYLHKRQYAIQITTAHAYTYIYVDDNNIIIKSSVIPNNPIIQTTQYELANPNTNILQITKAIINFINSIPG